jgi:membrane protein implicated in regulation of membrane protease activity
MGWFANNIIETVLIIGIVLLIVEVAVLGFSTFFLFFAGLAALVTSALMWMGVVPETFLYSLISVAALSALFAVLLWKPLAKMQKSVDTTRPSSDLVGHTFVLPEDVIATAAANDRPKYLFSGIEWRLQSESNITKGTRVEVCQIDVGILWVKAK